MDFDLQFAPACLDDVPALVELINSAYRGESSRAGWTTEADLLDGKRTDAAELSGLLKRTDSLLIVCKAGAVAVGSVHLQRVDADVHIGMLAVSPPLQGGGIGKRLLHAAETQAQNRWPLQRFLMFVIPCRSELIDYYRRRGYRATGIFTPFPLQPQLWRAKVEGLSLEMLEKTVADRPG